MELKNWENEGWGNQHGYMASWEIPELNGGVFLENHLIGGGFSSLPCLITRGY
jgi:hypothetical protein